MSNTEQQNKYIFLKEYYADYNYDGVPIHKGVIGWKRERDGWIEFYRDGEYETALHPDKLNQLIEEGFVEEYVEQQQSDLREIMNSYEVALINATRGFFADRTDYEQFGTILNELKFEYVVKLESEIKKAEEKARPTFNELEWKMILFAVSGLGLVAHKSGDFYEKHSDEFDPSIFDIEEFSDLYFKVLANKKKVTQK